MTTISTERAGALTLQVAEEIRAIMGRRRITGAELARRLGVSQMWVSDRLLGKTPINLTDLERIAEVLSSNGPPVTWRDLIPASRGKEDTLRYPISPARLRPLGGPRVATRSNHDGFRTGSGRLFGRTHLPGGRTHLPGRWNASARSTDRTEFSAARRAA